MTAETVSSLSLHYCICRSFTIVNAACQLLARRHVPAAPLIEHWSIYFPRVLKRADPEEAKKLAMKLAKITKKEMTNLQKIVPGMSDYEAWTETIQTCCITPYPPEIPKAPKQLEKKKITKKK